MDDIEGDVQCFFFFNSAICTWTRERHMAMQESCKSAGMQLYPIEDR